MAAFNDHSGDVAGSRIFALPKEVLLDTLLLTQPHDVSSFSQTCWQAHQLVASSSHLWRGLYLKAWDPVEDAAGLCVLSPSQPQVATSSASDAGPSAKRKGKARKIDDPPLKSPMATGETSIQSLVKARAKARLSLRTGASDPHHLLLNHSTTLRELIAATRSRAARNFESDRSGTDDPSSRSAATLSSIFPRNQVGDARWAAFVYPREDLERLQDWQHDMSFKEAVDERKLSEKSVHRDQSAKSHNTKRHSTGASTPTNRKRGASAAAKSTTRTSPRRSARLRNGAIPRDLHPFLGKGALSDVEALGKTLREWHVQDELSAELHVLHGVRRMKRDSPLDRLEKAERKLSEGRAQKRQATAVGAETSASTSQSQTRSRSGRLAALRSTATATDDEAESTYDSTYEEDRSAEDDLRFRPAFSEQTMLLAQQNHDAAGDEEDSDYDGGGGGDDDGDDNHDDEDEDMTGSHTQSSIGLEDGDFEVMMGYATPSDDEMDYYLDMDLDETEQDYMPSFFFGRQLERADLLLGSEEGPVGDPQLRGRAKSVVYDVGRFSYENSWGPFKPFRDSRDRPANPIGPFAIDDEHDSDDSGDHHDDPIVYEEASSEEDDDNASAQPPQAGATIQLPNGNYAGVAPGFEVSDGYLHIPGEPSVPTDLLAGIISGQTPVNGLDNQAASDGPMTDHALADHTDAANLDDDDDGDMSAELSPESNDFSDDSALDDFYAQRDDIFARRVAWVGAYAGSKVRETVLNMQKARGEDRSKARTSDRRPWKAQREVDWILLESIMIVAHCNIIRGIRSEGWGQGFILPPGARGNAAHSIDQLMAPQTSDYLARLKHLLPPSGWSHSRGSADMSTHRDWAKVESSVWVGTYFFCDYPIFLKYNTQLATSPPYGHFRGDGDVLMHHREAIGDCLALRLELLTPEEEAEHKKLEGATGNSIDVMGEDDPQFPTLRFKGATYTYTSETAEPVPRGRTHGFVRPVYASEEESAHRPYLKRRDPTTGRCLPEVVALHWNIVHAYDGQDRWSLTGVQPGSPGTRAPIYGAWSDVEDARGSPVGPFVYFTV